MITRKYNLINNLGGWIVFAIALATYWLTLEPTASYWDCGEFIIQADKLEVGHPPGNPIFMLTARFFANFAPSAAYVSVMVNAMSGLLSALTIMLLFWTITHLVRRLTVRDGQRQEPTLQQYLAIIGSGAVGALAYCWSDTFWFSAVEGEVYAFSSFCTALVFWLILKWENRADEPHSDRYLILIAYIIGVSVAVHLLNLLCIPAIVLVFAYRKFKDMTLLRSLLALLVSFGIIVLVLYGLVPGFIKVAQQFELLFVNGFGLPFNSGALAYTAFTLILFLWSLYELDRQRSGLLIRISFILAVAISGMLFFGNTAWIGIVLILALAAFLFFCFPQGLPVRVLNVIMWSTAVIFAGYSSYALILIRSTAATPMNQNAPDNVFDLASYLSREQYGENPLIYGETFASSTQKRLMGYNTEVLGTNADGQEVTLSTPVYQPIIEAGKPLYVKGVAGAKPHSDYNFLTEADSARSATLSARGKDFYVKRDYKPEARLNPELNMLFPRLYSSLHRSEYARWTRLDTVPANLVEIHAIDDATGSRVTEFDVNAGPSYNELTGMVSYPAKFAYKPTYGQNLEYFLNYQLGHMYLRYFMWNFAGRQNDINNQFGELDAGNWISGIPAIDNARLGDQSLLPEPLGTGNKGHNVYYMLPLILGILGLLWQAFAGRRGIEQFWVVFFLFFMTGIAIVIYLNQTPNQPRERDYAFAGSFYAYAIWIGMGVAALWRIILWMCAGKKHRIKSDDEEVQPEAIINEPKALAPKSRYAAIAACILGIAVPAQMVSQTWDDHDRSGRYAARDYAINYLNSLEPNAIVFCNGDNDTFPLWYAQEVEGVRPDVRIINLSYLSSDWYANQQRIASYEAAPVSFTATPQNYAYGLQDVNVLGPSDEPTDLLASLRTLYSPQSRGSYGYPTLPSAVVKIPVDKEAVIRRGLVAPKDSAEIVDDIIIDLGATQSYRQKRYLSLGEVLMLDIIATNAAEGWPRPIYWCSTVGTEYHLGLTPYLRSTGMTHQLVPTMQEGMASRTDRAYDVVSNYRWGGADKARPGHAPYFDETAVRMLASTRSSMIDVASQLLYEGDLADAAGDKKEAREAYGKALSVLRLMEKNLNEYTSNYTLAVATSLAQLYCELGEESRLADKTLSARGLDLLRTLMKRYAPYIAYNQTLSMRFAAPVFTTETSYIPYQYYRFIELFERFGGKSSEVEAIIKPYGLNLDTLKSYYEALYADAAPEGAGELASYAEQIGKYAEVALEMASLSPQDYAARSAEEKIIDSMYYEMVHYYLAAGGDAAGLERYPNCVRVDMERARRLSDEYAANHPEAVQP